MVYPLALKITVFLKNGSQEYIFMRCDKDREICFNLNILKSKIVKRIPELLQYDEIKFFWIDEDGDEIPFFTQADYMDCLDMLDESAVKRRIYVRGVSKQAESDQPMQEAPVPKQEASTSDALPEDVPVHSNIVCDVCDNIIRGYRYKCLQCFNYDLCMRCEAKFRHKDHLMVRIPSPDVYRRTPSRVFEKLRSYVGEMNTSNQEDEYENCKRSKRHHRRHSKDREESKDRQEEKERKERKHRRERSAKASEERRSAGRRCGTGFGHSFNFSHLINQVIDPANIHSAFVSSDAAAAAAAAAAESAQEAARAAMSNCPIFAAPSTSSSASASATATATATSAPAASETNASAEMPAGASAPPPTNEEPQAKTARQQRDFDFSWLAPTPESIQRINETFSKLLDPLGMNIEIRSNGSTPKPAQTQTPTEEKKDQTTETANTPTTSTPSQTTSVAGGSTSKSTEMDPIAELEKKLEAALLAEPFKKNETEQSQEAAMSTSDDDSSSVSSVSLLSDNEETAAAENLEKRWTLVDLPDDDEGTSKKVSDKIDIGVEVEVKNIAEEAASGSTPKSSAAPATPASVPEVASASSTNNNVPQIDYEQLGKALKQHLEAEKQGSQSPTTSASTPASTAQPPKEASPPRTNSAPPQPSTSTQASTSTAQSPNTMRVIHSKRPHVNFAVNAMMAMGFSNEGGWLTQLLESVNGDIPRALDHLTPHKITQ